VTRRSCASIFASVPRLMSQPAAPQRAASMSCVRSFSKRSLRTCAPMTFFDLMLRMRSTTVEIACNLCAPLSEHHAIDGERVPCYVAPLAEHMAEQRITDAQGRAIGFIRDSGGGKTAHDGTGRMLGRYEKVNDKTFNATGTYVGPGDQLMRLLGGR
jgi:hypothetical protein